MKAVSSRLYVLVGVRARPSTLATSMPHDLAQSVKQRCLCMAVWRSVLSFFMHHACRGPPWWHAASNIFVCIELQGAKRTTESSLTIPEHKQVRPALMCC